MPPPQPSLFAERDEDPLEGPPGKKIKLDVDEPQLKEEPIAEVGGQDNLKDTQKSALGPSSKSLPPVLLSLLKSIQSTLQTTFPTAPPHTAQRLAELLLNPKQHYRTLPSYLRALDRIVSVASPATIFPLPTIQPTTTTNGTLLNGTLSNPSSPRSGEEEADFIGGAELTEIPWLRDVTNAEALTATGAHNRAASDLRTESTSLIDGPHGAGSVETVTVNTLNGISTLSSTSVPRDESTSSPQGVTQGEILRQEQEAGVVPVPSPSHGSTTGRVTRASTAASQAAFRATGVLSSSASEVQEEEAEYDVSSEEEKVHARGPNTIGMEDMGPQAPGSGLEGGIDLEGVLGRRGEGALTEIEPEEDIKEVKTAETGPSAEKEGQTKDEPE